MKLRELTRAEAAGLWPALEQAAGVAGGMAGWAWTRTWLEHFGGDVRHRLLAGAVDGADVGVALVCEDAARFPPVVGARQAWIGTAGEPRGASVFVERNRLVVAAPHRAAFAAALLSAVDADRRWDRLVLPGLLPEDAAAYAAADPRLALERRGSPVTALDGGDPLEALGSGARRRARKALREIGPLAVEPARDAADAQAILGELITLHQARWTAAGEPGAFADPRFVAFHRALVGTLGDGALLVRVRAEGATLGCVYGIVEGRRLLFYQGGLERRDGLNAGLVVHLAAMRVAAARGLEAYDFLAPESRYKRELSTRTDTLVWASRERAGARVRLDRRLRALRAGRQER